MEMVGMYPNYHCSVSASSWFHGRNDSSIFIHLKRGITGENYLLTQQDFRSQPAFSRSSWVLFESLLKLLQETRLKSLPEPRSKTLVALLPRIFRVQFLHDFF
jgi:hypothetical protein